MRFKPLYVVMMTHILVPITLNKSLGPVDGRAIDPWRYKFDSNEIAYFSNLILYWNVFLSFCSLCNLGKYLAPKSFNAEY